MAASQPKYCVVLGCKNTEIELNIWRRTPCFVQSHLKKVRAKCGCPVPFVLFPFPQSGKLRSVWLKKIGLQQLEVNHSTCVCSIHFEKGRPTPEKFYPTLYMQIEEGDLLDEDSDDEDEMSETEANEQSPIVENNFHYEEEEECDIDQLTGNLQANYDCSVEFSNSNDVEIITDKGVMGEESDDEVKVIYQAPKITRLAQYDPNHGVLQVSNPVKYIQECHKKIAELTSENASLRSNYENEVRRLQEKNRALKRKFAADPDVSNAVAESSKRAQVQSTD